MSDHSSLYIDDVFDQVADLPPDEQDAQLKALCVHHASIERSVRAMLPYCHPSPEEETTEPNRAQIGSMVGRFRLEHCLGEGATASVWQAWDTQLHTWTALKLLHPDICQRLENGSGALEAVLLEARAASKIASEYVVRIKEAGRAENNWPYIAMELCAEHQPTLDGSQKLVLGSTLCSEEWTTKQAVSLICQAAQGVNAAHVAGVLHRDIKPANILVLPVTKVAKVTDFGLAAPQLYPSPTPTISATSTVTIWQEADDGRLVGTPSFMAPEQAFAQPATRATDIYSLGATLYALLAGHPPYEARENSAIPALDVIEQVRAGAPPPLTGVDKSLTRIIHKAMARSPRDRYATAELLATDLRCWLDDKPTVPDQHRPLRKMQLWLRRNRGMVTSTAVLLGLLFTVGGAAAYLGHQRQTLSADILRADARLQVTTMLTQRAERSREQALHQRDEARAQSVVAAASAKTAIAGAHRADRRFNAEKRARLKAAEAKDEATDQMLTALQSQAEAERAAAEAANRAAQDAKARAESARVATQALTDLSQRINELEIQRRASEDIARAIAADRAAWEAERDALEAELTVLRQRSQSVAQPVPPQQTDPAPPENELPAPQNPAIQ